MTAYTTSQAGNWSDAATWGGGGVPGDGDTATLAHAVTLDTSATVGTSPNDTTTTAFNFSANNVILTFAAGVTLTVKGNMGLGNSGCGLTMGAGSSMVFDNSGSGGSPVYTWTGVQTYKLTCNGTSGARCSISAITGQTILVNQNFTVLSLNYTDFTRFANNTLFKAFGAIAATADNCLWNSCGKISLTSTTGAWTLTNSTYQNGTQAEGMAITGTLSSSAGARTIRGNKIYGHKFVIAGTWNKITNNYFEYNVTVVSPTTWDVFAHNVINTAGEEANTFCGDDIIRCYYTATAADNPHYMACKPDVAEMKISQCIVEAYTPDTVDSLDTGDFIGWSATNVANGETIVGSHNIILPATYPDSNPVSSGTLLTQYNASTGKAKMRHNTCNMNDSVKTNSPGKRAAIAINEAGGAVADSVEEILSNVVWGSSADQGYLVERVSGTTTDIITEAGCDYNWRYNSPDGDNQRGYDCRTNSGDLWTAGDAVDAGVDTHQGTGDPQFVDPTRNMAKWATARGYGSTRADAIAAIEADTTRIPDLIDYVFEGFKVANTSMRTAGHDGTPPGAANFHKAARQTTTITAINAYF